MADYVLTMWVFVGTDGSGRRVDLEYNVTLDRSADRRVPIEHLRPDVHGIAAADGY